MASKGGVWVKDKIGKRVFVPREYSHDELAKAYSGFMDTLSPEARSGVEEYSGFFHWIQGRARGEDVGDNERADAAIAGLQAGALAGRLPRAGVLYRSVSEEAAQTLIDRGQQSDPAFQATTIHQSFARRWAPLTMGGTRRSDTKYLVKILTRPGDRGVYMSGVGVQHASVGEFVLPRNTRLRYVSHETAPDGVMVITARIGKL